MAATTTSLDYYRTKLTGSSEMISTLYKFHPIRNKQSNELNKYLFDALSFNYLWHSDPITLNDPFDCYQELISYTKPSDEDIKWYVDNKFIVPRAEKRKEIIKLRKNPQPLNDLFKATTPIWYICSFTANQVSNTMWSHYADCHTGVCLTFDNQKLANSGILAYKISYENSFKPTNYFAEPEQAILNMITTKSIEWDYEDELRSFNERIGRYMFDKSALTGVTFGCKTPVEDIKIVRETIDNANYVNVKWYQAHMQHNSFDLLIKPL